MKGRFVALVGVFCIAMLIASGAYADKPKDKPDKPGKPPRPGNIAVECIAFTGPMLESVEDGTLVIGCCPNAGPSPAYWMALDVQGIVDGTVVNIVDGVYDGYLFAKPVTTRVKGQKTVRYKVQFNTWDWETGIPGDDDYFIEVYSDGDDIDETNGVLTVTFNNDHEDDTATIWVLHKVKPECYDTYPYCDSPSPCVDMEPACDPSDDDNCYHPCNEEIPIANVSFEMVKTTDLSYFSEELGVYCPEAAP